MSITIESNQLLKNLLVDLPSVLMAFAYGAGLLSIGLVTLLLVVQRFTAICWQRRVPDVYASCHAG